ncbi:hypothetical protein GA0115245_14663 [Streptomyces sp. di188]|nr:hypothetical protein GA0115245_14663 [Streptomyces sp. di188]
MFSVMLTGRKDAGKRRGRTAYIRHAFRDDRAALQCAEGGEESAAGGQSRSEYRILFCVAEKPAERRQAGAKIVVLSPDDAHSPHHAPTPSAADAECLALTWKLRRRGTLVLSVFALVWALAGASGTGSATDLVPVSIEVVALAVTAVAIYLGHRKDAALPPGR